MKFETLRNNKKILLATVIVFVFILTLIISTSLAKYKITESINIASGTINYSPADLSIMGIYLEGDNGYVSSDTIPESGYTLNSEESYCKVGDSNVDVTIRYDIVTKKLTISPMTNKGMKCYLYFDESLCPSGAVACESIMANINLISVRDSFSNVVTASSTGLLYSAEDDDGTSYYYAGAPTDNYVKFAGFYWRIIRINGNGSIRLIYSGEASKIDSVGKETVLKNGYNDNSTGYLFSASDNFNSKYSNNMYVGYMYTSGVVHGLGTSSHAKTTVENWYKSNLLSYASFIDANAGFCGDRMPSTVTTSLNGNGGVGGTTTYYGAYIRLITNKEPSLKCQNTSDLYTVSNANNGNKALAYPVGLITADEVVFSGAVYEVNNLNYYLYTGQSFWTITPSCLESSDSFIYRVGYYGNLNHNFPESMVTGMRPVINLRNDVIISGSGTIASPYIIS